MKAPVRLRESSSAMRDVLLEARKTRPMTDLERARIVAQGAKIAALPAAAPVASSPIWFGVVKVGLGIVVVAAGASKLVPAKETEKPLAPLVHEEKEMRPPELPAIASAKPETSAFVAPMLLPSVSVQKPVVRRAKPISSAISVPEVASGDELVREARQLAEAGALVGTNPNEALRLLEAHQVAFPRGKLGIEREVLTLDALMRAGRKSEARARGEALLSRTNGSMYEARVRRILEAEKP